MLRNGPTWSSWRCPCSWQGLDGPFQPKLSYDSMISWVETQFSIITAKALIHACVFWNNEWHFRFWVCFSAIITMITPNAAQIYSIQIQIYKYKYTYTNILYSVSVETVQTWFCMGRGEYFPEARGELALTFSLCQCPGVDLGYYTDIKLLNCQCQLDKLLFTFGGRLLSIIKWFLYSTSEALLCRSTALQ